MLKKEHVGINLTRRCNLKCPHCFYANLLVFQDKIAITSSQHKLDINLEKIKEKLQKINLHSVYLSGGEPLLYPCLKELITWLSGKCEQIYLCTNGLLIDDAWMKFLKKNNIICLWSIRNNSEKIFRMVEKAFKLGIEIHFYHVLGKDSLLTLKQILHYSYQVEKIRLLYGTGSLANNVDMIECHAWFQLLEMAQSVLGAIQHKVEIEIAFVPAAHFLGKDKTKGAVKRIYIDVDGKIYSCPLLVGQKNSNEGTFAGQCSLKKCPVFKEKMVVPNEYTRVCPFVLMDMKNLTYIVPKNVKKYF